MSYSSRVYRQRNPKPQDESKEKPFFSEQKQNQDGKNINSFFQSKPAANKAEGTYENEADPVAETVVNPDQGRSVEQHKDKKEDPLMEKEKAVQKKGEDEKVEKEIQKKGEEEKKEKEIRKKDEPIKEEEKNKSK